MSLSQNIKKFRIQKEMTQEHLADILGVTAQAVSKWETSETYPDGALLAAIANTLDVSLDTLFDNKVYSMKDLSVRIRGLIANAPQEQKFHLIRDIGWQIEKGLFGCLTDIEDDYSPEEINNQLKSSYILNDYGFTHISNGPSPFFSVFPEYGNNLTDVIGNGEEMRIVFKALSSPETMKGVLFILGKKKDYVFEAEVLSEVCEIPFECIDKVLDDLAALHMVYKNDLEIDGKIVSLYYSNPDHRIIPLLLFARELNYHDGYCLQSHHRNKPYLKQKQEALTCNTNEEALQ